MGIVLRQEDLRITTCRTAVVHWHAHGQIVHLPTGLTIEFEETWNDRSGRKKALDEMRNLIALKGIME
jgi:hypothetical protein